MIQGLYSVEEISAMIEKGDTLLLGGDTLLLSALPKGKWIGGTTSQFIENKKLIMTREKIFVHNITDIVANVKFKTYDASTIHNVYDDAFDNGFSVMITPFYSEVKNEYALNCINYSNFVNRVVCGWISVTPTYTGDERDVSLVYSGETGLSYDNAGVVMHIELPEEKYAEIHSFNPYLPEKGDEIIFEESGHIYENVLINGVRQNFKQYMIDKKIDRSPQNNNLLVGDYSGISINAVVMPEIVNTVILPELENANIHVNTVTLGNPVFKDIPYHFATLNSEESYEKMQQIEEDIVFSFSCATNFVFPDDFSRYLTRTNGPFCYGEYAYFLLNTTTVYVAIGNKSN